MVFASGNAGKAAELQALLGEHFDIVLQGELGIESIAETGTTFAANSLLKARHAAQVSGLAALADDSGLEVDALHGAPGVYSARYAGRDASSADNVTKLLADLRDVPAAKRAARFRCVLTFLRGPEDAQPIVVAGTWEGSIALVRSGSAGFGYDPVFIDGTAGRTAAELTAAEKNARSHRGQALQLLLPQLGVS